MEKFHEIGREVSFLYPAEISLSEFNTSFQLMIKLAGASEFDEPHLYISSDDLNRVESKRMTKKGLFRKKDYINIMVFVRDPQHERLLKEYTLEGFSLEQWRRIEAGLIEQLARLLKRQEEELEREKLWDDIFKGLEEEITEEKKRREERRAAGLPEKEDHYPDIYDGLKTVGELLKDLDIE